MNYYFLELVVLHLLHPLRCAAASSLLFLPPDLLHFRTTTFELAASCEKPKFSDDSGQPIHQTTTKICILHMAQSTLKACIDSEK